MSHQEELDRDLDQQTDRDNFRLIAIGEEASMFLNSKLAEFICSAAEAKVYDAVSQLKRVNPTDINEIVRLQGIIEKFDHYQGYLEELVAAGKSAYQIYLEDQEADNS